MAVVFKNNANTILASDITSTATSISVLSGSVFPSLSAGEYFLCTLDDDTNNEIVKVTAISGNTLTVERAQEGTTARAFSTSDTIESRVTAGIMDLFPQLDGGEITADEFIGDFRGSVLFKAQAGEALSKGDVVYISGISGNTTVVSKADADDAAKMPAFGVASATASINTPVDVYTTGILSNIDTSSFSVGDQLFVSNTPGSLTDTPPTGESSALQKIAKVTRSDASSGSIFITGAGRSNAVPNLNDGKIFLGNGSNQAVSTTLDTSVVPENTNLYYTDARVQAVSINNVVEDTTPQLGGDLASNGNDILFGDNDKAVFGAGSDLQIYHDGSNSYIDDAGVGVLAIRSNSVRLQKYTGEEMVKANADGAVTIYYDNAEKLATTSTGIDVTGEVVATSFSDGTISGITFIDEDSFTTNSATRLPTQQSVKSYVDAQVAGVVDSAPAALDTLNELAAALGDDANFSTTTSTALGNRLRVDTAAQGLTGTQQANAITNLGITATKAELNYVDGVTSNIQTQLDGKQASGSYLTGNQTITLSGDVSGSGTTSIAVTIADDSHNHVISNVDGLQTALDAKLASSSYTASDVLTKIKTVDGAGSGLDADLLDGISSGSFLRSDATDTASGALTFSGAVTFDQGTNTLVTISSGDTGAAGLVVRGDSQGTGYIQVGQSSSYGGGMFYNGDGSPAFAGGETADHIGFYRISNGTRTEVFHYSHSSNDVNFNGNITVSGTVDGRDIASDGSKLDGIESGATADQSASEILTLIKTVDGAGSGLDADLLDGISSASFLRSDATDTFTTLTGTTLTVNGVLSVRNAIDLADNDILRFGSSDDVEFFCNGSHMYTDLNSGIGNWYIRDGTTTRFTFDDAGHFTATGNVTAYSDERLKDNILVIDNALEKVSQLRGVTFNRTDTEETRRQTGVIAQEVEKVLPEAVITADDEMQTKSVAYGNMVGLLIEAIKEQQIQIDDLKQQLNEQKEIK